MIAPDTQALEPSDAPEWNRLSPEKPDPGNAPQDAPQTVCVPDWPPCPDPERLATLQADLPEREQERKTSHADYESTEWRPTPPPLPGPGPELLAEAERVRALEAGEEPVAVDPGPAQEPPPETQARQARLNLVRRHLAPHGWCVHEVGRFARCGYLASSYSRREFFTDLTSLTAWTVREGLL